MGAFRREEDQRRLVGSETEPSLCALVEKWLERTPGLESEEFWPRYQQSIEAYLSDVKMEVRKSTLCLLSLPSESVGEPLNLGSKCSVHETRWRREELGSLCLFHSKPID